MHNAPKPAGGQPANLPAETSANPSRPTYWIPGTPLTPAAAAAERERLIATIALAEEAQHLAADHRSERHAPGETMEQTTARWDEAFAIETAAEACRKAARSALAAVAVFPDVRSPDAIASKIHLARCAALALKRACDAGQEAAQRRRVDIAARALAAGIAENEARHARHEARAKRSKKGGAK